jgi:hypothetical protein
MVLRSIFKATFLHANPFLVVSLLEASEPPTHLCEHLASNICSPSYPVLKSNETRYRLPKQFYAFAEFCCLSDEHTDEEEVFAKRAAQMADGSLDTIHPFISKPAGTW